MNFGVELLRKVAPPISLMETLEKSNMPKDVQAWWNLWTAIRSNGSSEIDGMSEDAYQQALLKVEMMEKEVQAA